MPERRLWRYRALDGGRWRPGFKSAGAAIAAGRGWDERGLSSIGSGARCRTNQDSSGTAELPRGRGSPGGPSRRIHLRGAPTILPDSSGLRSRPLAPRVNLRPPTRPGSSGAVRRQRPALSPSPVLSGERTMTPRPLPPRVASPGAAPTRRRCLRPSTGSARTADQRFRILPCLASLNTPARMTGTPFTKSQCIPSDS